MDADDAYQISTDPDRLDMDWIHKVLSTDTYWAPGRPRERVERSVEHSVCYGVYDASGRQLGFARLVTDRTHYGLLCDVYIDRELRGRGWGKRLVGRIMDDADAMELRRVILATDDAAELYRRFGFEDLSRDRHTWMHKLWPERL